MKFSYIPYGVCPTEIFFEIEDGILKSLSFQGGCHGNLQALSRLLEGQPVSYVKDKLEGIRCGHKTTSCGDQLVRGIEEALKKMGERHGD